MYALTEVVSSNPLYPVIFVRAITDTLEVCLMLADIIVQQGWRSNEIM